MTAIKTQKKAITTAFIIIFTSLILSGGDISAGENRGRLYVIGAGPAGADLTAPRALDIIKNADVILTSPGLPARMDRFEGYIDPSKIAFNPWENILGGESSALRKNDPEAWEKGAAKQRAKVQSFIKARINEGKTVAMIDGGDAAIYGPSLNYLLKGMDRSEFEVIPGMGAVNAAAAALKSSLTPEGCRFVMMTSFNDLFGGGSDPDTALLEDISRYESTLVLYMSLRSIDTLAYNMKRFYPEDLPLAIVYYAGFNDKEMVLRSTIGTITEDIKKMDENWLGLVVIGKAAE